MPTPTEYKTIQANILTCAQETGWILVSRLIFRLEQFILELSYGFCFVGRQYRLALGRKKFEFLRL